MNDECGEWKVKSRKKYDGQTRILLISVFSLLGVLILVACSSQQPISSTICDNGFHLLGGLDNMIEISNNEEWILANCESNNGVSKYVRVFRVDGTASWTITIDTFPWSKEDDPLSGLGRYHWTNDGKYVYLSPFVCCFDPTNHGVFVTSYSLYLLNLQTGEFSVVVSGKDNSLSPFSVTISPDEKYLVYVDLASAPNVLSVTNLQVRKTKLLEIDGGYVDTGAFVWTPDNNKLIFVAVSDGWTASSLFSLDMNSFMLETIINEDERLLFPTSKWGYQGDWSYWKDENTIFLSEFAGANDWALNIQTMFIQEDNSPDSRP